MIRPGVPIEMCTDIPGFDIDLFVETSKVSLTSVLLGRSTVSRELDSGRMFLSGAAILAKTMQDWLHISSYADCDGVLLLDEDREAAA